MYKPSDTYRINFFTSNFTTGALAYADSLPVVKFMINGVDQTTAANAVVASGSWTGQYEVTATIPSSAVNGDNVEINVLAAVSSVSGAQCVDHFKVEGYSLNDLNTTLSSITTGMTDLLDNSFGKWTINVNTNVLTLYRQDGNTVLKVFDLTPTSNGEYVERIPQ